MRGDVPLQDNRLERVVRTFGLQHQSVFRPFMTIPRRRLHVRPSRPASTAGLALLSFLILPNLPYLTWLSQFTPTRALVNVDYLLLGIVSPWLAPALLVIGFVAIAIIDAFVFVSMLYHFTPRELAMSMSYVRYNPIKWNDLPFFDILLSALVVMVAVILARSSQLRYRIKGENSGSKALVLGLSLCLFALVSADVLNGTNTFGPITRLPFYARIQHVEGNAANSGLLASDPASFLPLARRSPLERMVSASGAEIDIRRLGPEYRFGRTNVALVLVESWGRIEGRDDLVGAVAAPLFTPEIRAKYDIKVGFTPFRGSTTNAELRELCGLHGDYRSLFNLPRSRCLPDAFKEAGYRTIGLHGFHSDMFDRASWWPLVGVTEGVFLKDLRRKGYSRTCGTAFPGVCDDDLIREMGNQLTERRRFVYALTINSHLPLRATADADGDFRCSAPNVFLSNEGCALAQHWHRTMKALASNALRKDIKETTFIIVGDHSPPLLGTADQHFSTKTVPYVILTPRAQASQG